MLGTTLDNVVKGDRWKRWRPTVAACSQPDFVFDRYEIIYPIHFKRLLDQVVADLKVVSPKTEIVLHQLEMANPWDFEEVFAKLHDFMNRYSFDLEREEYFVNITTGTHVAQICLFLLAESRYLPGRLFQVGLVKGGDPKGTYSVIDLDLKKYNPIAARFEKEKDQSEQFLKAGIVTRNSNFNILIDQIEMICLRSRDPLLLMGRTGVGKTELARRIFQLKKAKHKILGRFVEVNCATLKGDAVMSMLFGHVKGASTGALKERNGLLKEADGGLIFLDEIGELGLDEQAMLLRAIEDKKFLPMGTDRDVSSDFELIAGTNRDLNADVQNGRFREDLLARINLWAFRLPDLKERREDIEPNLEFELTKFSTKTGKKLRFNQEALAAFLKFAHAPSTPWRGNFRDLNSAITRMGTFAESGRISLDLVETEIIRMQATWQKGSDSESERTVNGESGRGVAYHRVAALLADRVKDFDSFDLAQLEAVLETCAACSSLSEASRKLFAVSRLKKVSANDADRLTKYLQRFGLVAKDVVGVRSPAQSISF
jgi:transcriptional regulatory protein RtcR